MAGSDAEDADHLLPPRKRRRGGEIGRDWKCDVDGCSLQKNALDTHTQVTHLGRRDYICPEAGCGQTYGYKHLLQRHLAKAHRATSDHDTGDESEWVSGYKIARKASSTLDIDTITGHAYAQRTHANIANATALLCPYPLLGSITLVADNVQAESGPQTHETGTCNYAFSRAYDLRRHLKAVHGIDTVKESVDEWVTIQKHVRRLAVDSSSARAPSTNPVTIKRN